MSRSFKKAIITCTKKLGQKAHRIVRRRVRARLKAMDVEEPVELTLLDIEATTRQLGLEKWGTKIGWEFEDPRELADTAEELKEYEEQRKQERRK